MLDFLESQGVLGSNNHIYYSDPTLLDGDGDGVSDSDELGVTYIVSRAEDGSLRILLNKVVVYENDEGVIDPESQYYVLSSYFNNVSYGHPRSITVLRSDVEKIDSDEDGSNDAVDIRPIHVNPLVNYIFYGDDIEGENVIQRSLLLYNRLFDDHDMDCIAVHVTDTGSFELLWSNLKNAVVEDGRIVFSDYEYYRGVDNLVIIAHGDEFSNTVLKPNAPIGERESISASDYEQILSNCSTHINSVEFSSCYSAFGGVQWNPAVAVAIYGNVDRTYGYDGFSRCAYPLQNYCCYFESDCDGYYCFTRIGSPDSESSLNDCVSYVSVEPSMTRSEVTDIIPWNDEIVHYIAPIHSYESEGE